MIDVDYIRGIYPMPAVVYEIDHEEKQLHTFCPNCGQHKFFPYNKKYNLKYYKHGGYTPCCCACDSIRWVSSAQKGFATSSWCGQIEVVAKDEFFIKVYDIRQSIELNEYDCVLPFARRAVIDQSEIVRIHFKGYNAPVIDTRLKVNGLCHSISVGYDWRRVKSWSTAISYFDLVDDFELKLEGTIFEKAIDFVDSIFFCRVNELNSAFGACALVEYVKRPVLRNLFDHGFVDLCYQLVYFIFSDYRGVTYRDINPRGRDISAILRCPVQLLDRCFERGEVNMTDIKAVRWLIDKNLEVTIANCLIAREQFDLSRVSSAVEHLTGFSWHRFFKYIRNQSRRHNNESLYQVLHTYCDYVEIANKLQQIVGGTFVLYPTDLYATECALSAELTIAKTEVYNAGMLAVAKAVYDRVRGFANDKLMIVVPRNAMDLTHEGNMLGHCVGNYAERVATGESIILFVRRVEDPDKPYFTLEIKPDANHATVVQCRTVKNTSYVEPGFEEVKAFVDAFVDVYNANGDASAPHPVAHYFKAVKRTADPGVFVSLRDHQTQYRVGGTITVANANTDPDKVAVEGIHMASLEYACRFGANNPGVVIVELLADVHDTVIPDASDQVRASRAKVLRVVPVEELPERYRMAYAA